ncbi:hypothetical protein BT96DRAFT_1025276 [Gymnopus androsaceus JB14]|uniref:Glutamate/phenylalanine/leucine/valine/L-tryptophan dehydrogenase C-terminal domain-containing protein n=1 Tax=Gymnopus androsaceus JB14 TaxID=1447944 RepID=A0A6A4GSV5_9AGAR|nr:hypothetical protein BT96DRAFT_1025276 [Gymnopus androsaceus JB14]
MAVGFSTAQRAHRMYPPPIKILSPTVLLLKRLGPWVVPSQRPIFEKLELDGHALSLKNKSERLIAIFDKTPHLALGVQLLKYEGFYDWITEGVIQRLSKVDTIERGPDGDLGSNDILLKTVAIIDGSGVLADPAGLNLEELVRLTKLRLTVVHFDRTRFGYLVKIEEQDVKLPVVCDHSTGSHQHLEYGCALRQRGKTHSKYIVEGANLFLNKRCPGGVTSYSLEVLADGKPSEFYQSYVKDIQEKIIENTAAEFQCLWKEHTRLQGAKPHTTISDELSSTLNNLQAELESSHLFEDVPSRNGVMRRAIPKMLVEKLGWRRC